MIIIIIELRCVLTTTTLRIILNAKKKKEKNKKKKSRSEEGESEREREKEKIKFPAKIFLFLPHFFVDSPSLLSLPGKSVYDSSFFFFSVLSGSPSHLSLSSSSSLPPYPRPIPSHLSFRTKYVVCRFFHVSKRIKKKIICILF